jgi:tetratricopeptide (TPR) repeat protein
MLVVAVALGGPLLAQDASPLPLAEAQRLLLSGSYPEAIERFETLLKKAQGADYEAAAAGMADACLAIGEREAAREALEQALKTKPDAADLWGRLAELQFGAGEWDAAHTSAEQAVRRNTDALRGRLVLAHLHREAGRLDEALEGYRWFVRYYNRAQPKGAVSLRLVAEGSLEYARWKRVTSVFHFVINTLCPDALQADPQDWRTAVLSGNLLLEKYNSSQATEEFEAALQLNANAAEAHVGLAWAALQDVDFTVGREQADVALAINPALLEALVVRAEVELAAEDGEAAAPFVERALAVNPRDQAALACHAACLLIKQGVPSRERLTALLGAISSPDSFPASGATKFEKLTLELARRNPKPGVYLNRLGEFFDGQKKYGQAEQCFRKAVEVMPQLAAARNNLGLLDMRTGQIEDARKILDEAFKADPFHVRVSNMRKVLGVLEGYETLRTEHFVVRVDQSERMLAEYMAEYLEELHAELAPQYGYDPPTPTQFEVYASAQGQTAHQWFSARMVGLPWIQTIGASTGMIVALASPLAVDEPFNWGRVLRHEYVHILTLQQTDFNIPHWFTEALAVRTEGITLPKEWQAVLARRVPAGDVYTLATIIDGFRRPQGPDDWTMAYCQSRLYARFIEENWGAESLAKLVDAYGRSLTTEAAIREVCRVEIAEFERRYSEFLQALVDEIERSQAEPEIEVEAAKSAHEGKPDDATLAGRYAYALWQAEQTDDARREAEATLNTTPGEPWSTAVLVGLAEADDDVVDALVDEAFDAESPHATLLYVLAERAFNQNDLDRAAELFQLGVDTFPLEESFWKGLAVAYLA